VSASVGSPTDGSTPRTTASTATSTSARTRRRSNWVGKRGETRTYTYLDLYHEVNEFAAALRSLDIEEDDVVTLYMPAIPELPVAMLACARIGAPQ